MFSLPNKATVAMLNHFQFRGCVTWRVEGEPPYVKITNGVDELTRERALGAIEALSDERNEPIDQEHPALAGISISDPPRLGRS